MGGDEGWDDDVAEFRPPLPPDDRIWRHPAEVAAELAAADRSGRSPWAVGFVSVVGGVLLVGSLMFVIGGSSGEPNRVSLQPVATLSPRPAPTEPTPVADPRRPEHPFVVSIDVAGGAGLRTGHGLVVGEDGQILTSAHLVQGASDIRVHLADGTVATGRVIGADPVNDLALVRIGVAGLVPASISADPGLRIGDEVRIVGGSRGDRSPSWSGPVASLDARLTSGPCDVHAALAVDARVHESAAGAPVLDRDGRVVGMATTVGGVKERAVAIPARTLLAVSRQLGTSGTVRHGWLGIEGVDADEEAARAAGVPGAAVVQRVLEGSPAQAAGLDPGDLVIAVRDEVITSMGRLVVTVRELGPGAAAAITVMRGGDRLVLEAVLDEMRR